MCRGGHGLAWLSCNAIIISAWVLVRPRLAAVGRGLVESAPMVLYCSSAACTNLFIWGTGVRTPATTRW